MSTREELPQRKTPRAKWLEYNDGEYFVTVCTCERKHYFGQIEDDIMTLSLIGKCLDTMLMDASKYQSYIHVSQYVIMPNHFHAIISIDSNEFKDNPKVGTQYIASEKSNTNICQADAMYCVPTTKGYKRPLLSSFIALLKAAVTRHAHKNNLAFTWQSRYHDHAIRDYNDKNNITQYIANNVLNWKKDCFYQ